MAEKCESECSKFIGASIQGAFIVKGLLLGRRLGLLQALATTSREKAVTCDELATSLGLKERYVREWLGAMTSAHLVEISTGAGATTRYFMAQNMAKVVQKQVEFASVLEMLDVDDDIAACFKLDGPRGVAYPRYSKFVDWVGNYRKVNLINSLITDFVPSVPGLEEKLSSGATVGDMGCGMGVVCVQLAKHFPKSTFYGWDFLPEAVAKAKAYAEKESVTERCHFFEYDAVDLPEEWTGKFDVATTFDAIHDQARPDLALKQCCRVLKDDGMYVAQDVKGHTKHEDNVEEKEFKLLNPAMGYPVMYMISLMHCMPVSLYFEGGMGLGAMFGKEKALELLQAAGFKQIDAKETEHDPMNILYICRKN